MIACVLPSLFALLAGAPIASGAPSTAKDWHEEVVYQIYPASFADSNGDGMGDLAGITSKVDYLGSLGVDVIWLNPIFTSTHFDSGYDVSDYLDIDPMYGTLADFYDLRDALHARGMKIMLDLVLNHSSDQHPWFLQEKRLKALQYRMTQLMRRAGPHESERIINLLVDPDSRKDGEPTAALRAAWAAIEAFSSSDSAAAEAAGYPSEAEQMQNLARRLEPCAEKSSLCPGVSAPMDDFYIWRDKPNNWTSLFSGSAWHRVPEAHGYFMSLFSVHQIDLNWRNKRVREAMANVVATWEKRGMDGIRLDSLATLAKNPTFSDAPPDDHHLTGTGIKQFTNLPAVHRYLHDLAKVYTPNLRSIGETAFSHSYAAPSYAGTERGEVKEVFVFDQLNFDCYDAKFRAHPFDVLGYKREMGLQQHLIHGKAWLGNYVENHDQLRVVSRFGDDGVFRVQSGKLFAMLLMTLEGTPYIFQGQEIGMTNLKESVFKSVQDVQDIEARNYYAARVAQGEPPAGVLHQVATRCRDHVRTAMQWDSSAFAGFSKKPPQVRVNDNVATINVAQAQRDPDSLLATYIGLIKLRRSHRSWIYGAFVDELPNHPKVFAYSRTLPTEKSLVLLNLSGEAQPICLPEGALLQRSGPAVMSNYPATGPLARQITLQPWEARVYVGAAPTSPSAVAVEPGSSMPCGVTPAAELQSR